MSRIGFGVSIFQIASSVVSEIFLGPVLGRQAQPVNVVENSIEHVVVVFGVGVSGGGGADMTGR